MRDPDLSQLVNKRLTVHLSHARKVVGLLKGYDAFMNVVLDDAVDETVHANPVRLGTAVIRGVSIISIAD